MRTISLLHASHTAAFQKLLLAALAIASLAGCSGVAITSPNGSNSGNGSGGATAPTITTQPASQSVAVGNSATFIVAATGTAPLTYQWQNNGVTVANATSASYTTPAAASADNAAKFSVVVSNSAGNATSNIATLTVTSTPQSSGAPKSSRSRPAKPSRLANPPRSRSPPRAPRRWPISGKKITQISRAPRPHRIQLPRPRLPTTAKHSTS